MAKDIVAIQNLDEVAKQFLSSKAGFELATQTVLTRESQRRSAASAVEKAKADLVAAKAKVDVAKSDEKRVAALFSYTRVTAPYDAIVSDRNVNTGDFVLPSSGDPTRGSQALDNRSSTPLYVINRSDILISPSSACRRPTRLMFAQDPRQFCGFRHWRARSWRPKSRAPGRSITKAVHFREIDLVDPDPSLRPGMYAYGSILIERPHVRAVPLKAIIAIGNQPCVYCVIDGKAKTPVMLWCKRR